MAMSYTKNIWSLETGASLYEWLICLKTPVSKAFGIQYFGYKEYTFNKNEE